jgi:IgA Peptidase M64.
MEGESNNINLKQRNMAMKQRNNLLKQRFSKLKQRNIFIGLLLLMSFTAFSQEKINFYKYFSDNTLNLMCYHSGRYQVEYYAVDAGYKTEGFSGALNKLLDSTGLGNHRLEVYLQGSNTLIYSHNYSSLFQEWQTTGEAKNSCGNFEEVLRIPFPKENITLRFLSRDSLNGWFEVAKTDFAFNQLMPLSNGKYSPILLHRGNKDPHKALDIVIVPAGYSIADSAKMIRDMQAFSSYFYAKPPLKQNEDKINVWGVKYFSEQSGLAGLDSTISADSYLGLTYNTFGSERYIMTRNVFNLHEIIESVPYDQIMIMCNSSKYGGGAIFNYYATSYMDTTGFVPLHEFGHSFAGLGDEYADNDNDVVAANKDVEPWEKNLTTLKDFSSKWVSMLDKTTPVPTPCTPQYERTVGVFEGGAYMAKDIYRPCQDCMMRSARPYFKDIEPFCPVCSKEIKAMLDLYTK